MSKVTRVVEGEVDVTQVMMPWLLVGDPPPAGAVDTACGTLKIAEVVTVCSVMAVVGEELAMVGEEVAMVGEELVLPCRTRLMDLLTGGDPGTFFGLPLFRLIGTAIASFNGNGSSAINC